MKLEVGMYVRTKYGIAKYIKNLVTKATIYRIIDKKIVYDNVEDWEDCLLDNEILKASHNIIDLIEPKDIVVGIDGHKFEVYAVGSDCVYINGLKEFIYIHEIKSIVTKEQFESMSYRVGSEE